MELRVSINSLTTHTLQEATKHMLPDREPKPVKELLRRLSNIVQAITESQHNNDGRVSMEWRLLEELETAMREALAEPYVRWEIKVEQRLKALEEGEPSTPEG